MIFTGGVVNDAAGTVFRKASGIRRYGSGVKVRCDVRRDVQRDGQELLHGKVLSCSSVFLSSGNGDLLGSLSRFYSAIRTMQAFLRQAMPYLKIVSMSSSIRRSA